VTKRDDSRSILPSCRSCYSGDSVRLTRARWRA
jgi:hypothetical protein